MSVLFIDHVCPKPYSFDTLRNEPMGGTEATVVRIAEGLGAHVTQHNRTEATRTSQACYIPSQEALKAYNSVIVLRDAHALLDARKRFPDAQLYLWLHDIVTNDLVLQADILRATKPTILCVSDFHVLQAKDALKRAGDLPGVTLKRIYNPIDDALVPDQTPVDPHRLVFFSSPHKGLDYALQLFTYLRRIDPLFRLTIANPGYLASVSGTLDGVDNMGTLSHQDVIQHVRGALCVFYPNYVFRETFGLVFAEANAVGTPVITHLHGAAKEVLFHPAETLDVHNYKAVIDRVVAWRDGSRPKVRAKPEFRLQNVLQAWRRLLKL